MVLMDAFFINAASSWHCFASTRGSESAFPPIYATPAQVVVSIAEAHKMGREDISTSDEELTAIFVKQLGAFC